VVSNLWTPLYVNTHTLLHTHTLYTLTASMPDGLLWRISFWLTSARMTKPSSSTSRGEFYTQAQTDNTSSQ